MTDARRVVLLSEDRKALSIDVLVDSFLDYPVMRHVIDRSAPDYPRHLRALIGLFVGARISCGDPILAVESEGTPVAVATLTLPNGGSPGPEWDSLRESVWTELGGAARTRYEAFSDAWNTFGSDTRHYHVNMIGVLRGYQGRGLSRVLLDEVHRRSLNDPDSSGVSLSTEAPENVELYEHLGYSVTATVPIGAGIQTWGFFRPDDS
jgi:GNAT superfamily N-acetyltransferase